MEVLLWPRVGAVERNSDVWIWTGRSRPAPLIDCSYDTDFLVKVAKHTGRRRTTLSPTVKPLLVYKVGKKAILWAQIPFHTEKHEHLFFVLLRAQS